MHANTLTITDAYLADSAEDQTFKDLGLYYQLTKRISFINPDFTQHSSFSDVKDTKKFVAKQHNIMVFDGKTNTSTEHQKS